MTSLDAREILTNWSLSSRALVGFDLQFIHHRVDLLQIDSVDVKRPTDQTINSLGTLYPGQRMDFVLWPTQDTGHHSPMAVRLNQEYVLFHGAFP